MEHFALCDIVQVQIKVTGGDTYNFATADEISCEPVIEEGEALTLKLKNRVVANKEIPDMILGHDITCKDNVFSPAMLADIQGGTVTNDATKFKKYVAPAIGAMPQTKSFDFIAFAEIVDENGATGEYLKYTFPNCKGGFISPNLKDGEYYSNEYNIKSRPTFGTEAYTTELVTELPADSIKFEHPALASVEE